jgi:predicted RNase H-like HicB family nuclease
MAEYRFAVVVEKDEHGYFAYCPELQGCYTQGETFEEVMENTKDAIRLHVEDRLANNETIPTSEVVSLFTLEVMV